MRTACVMPRHRVQDVAQMLSLDQPAASLSPLELKKKKKSDEEMEMDQGRRVITEKCKSIGNYRVISLLRLARLEITPSSQCGCVKEVPNNLAAARRTPELCSALLLNVNRWILSVTSVYCNEAGRVNMELAVSARRVLEENDYPLCLVMNENVLLH